MASPTPVLSITIGKFFGSLKIVSYVCLVDCEFLVSSGTFAWCNLAYLPGYLHTGLKTTLGNSTIRVKIETILELG